VDGCSLSFGDFGREKINVLRHQQHRKGKMRREIALTGRRGHANE
jgi:hypothetical protein